MTYNLRSKSGTGSPSSSIPRPIRPTRGRSQPRPSSSVTIRAHTRSLSVQLLHSSLPSEPLSSSAPTSTTLAYHLYSSSHTMPTHGNNASGSSQGLQQGGVAPIGLQQVAPLGLQQAAPHPGVLPGSHFVSPGGVPSGASGGGASGGGAPGGGAPGGGHPGGGHPGFHHGSNATLVQLPTIVATTIPLPQQRSSRAPYFKGRDVEDFIINIEAIGKAAAFSELELPGIVLRYCSSKVKHTLEHDSSYFVTGSAWADTKAILMYYYAKSDEVNTTADSLRRFGQKSRKISNKKAFDHYMQEFSRKRGRLVEKNLISEGECDKLFYKGLPPNLRRRIKPTLAAMGEAERKPLSGLHPPPFKRTVDVVRKLFSTDDIDYSSEGEVSSSSDSDKKSRKKGRRSEGGSSSSDNSDAHTSSSDSDDNHSRRARSRKSRKNSKFQSAKSLKRQVEEKNSKISQLEDRLKSMAVTQEPPKAFSTAYAESTSQYGSPYVDPANQYISAYAPAPQFRQQQFQPQQSQLPKSCFMCGKVLGIDLDHPFPVKNCLELPALIDERILRFHPATGRLVKVSDNTELILSHRGPGGMAAALRRELSGQRDPPPHIAANASCMAISLCRNNEAVLRGDVHGASSHSFYSFPVTTRSQKAKEGDGVRSSPPGLQKQVRFRDHQEPANTSVPTSSSRPAVHHSVNEDLQFTHAENQPREYPSAPHSSNTREGWSDKQRNRQVDRRNDPKDKDKSLPYKFTSDIQTDISGEEVLKRVLEQKTSISLKELFGISPDLQKRLGVMVKTRREFNTQTSEVSHVTVEDDDEALIEVSALSDDDPGCAILTWDGDPADLPRFLERYTNAVSLRSPSKFYAKATGMVKGIFGGEEVTFLIDSGSELNLITRRVWEQTKVPIDEDGSRWSLKGLGGAPIPLIGCARDAPIQIEGKNFDHHFFVSTQEHGRYDGILGQPWLHWFSADIRYDRLGPTYLQAFPSGDKAGAFISVAITSIADPRNTDKLLLTGDAISSGGAGF